ncbi:hypothetical protein T01_4644, partial [Trichinella spiralis]
LKIPPKAIPGSDSSTPEQSSVPAVPIKKDSALICMTGLLQEMEAIHHQINFHFQEKEPHLH